MKITPLFITLLLCVTFITEIYCQDFEGKSNPIRLNIVKIEDGKVPKLEIENLRFIDSDLNSRLDANEIAKIKFNLVNKGEGRARNLKLDIKQTSNINGIEFILNQNLGNLNPQSSKEIIITIKSNMKLESGIVKADISISEFSGFSKYKNNPKQLQFPSLEFKSPNILIVDHTFSLPNGGKVTKGEIIDLSLQLQNTGQGKANDVKLTFTLDKNVLAIKGREVSVGILKAGDTKTCLLQIIANEEYDKENIEVNFTIDEYYNKYGESGTLKTSLNTRLNETPTIIAGKQWEETEIITSQLGSHIDKNIPKNNKVNKRFALIIGNEDYTSHQMGLRSEQNVDFAKNDARIFKEYALNTLGVKEENLIFKIDATSGILSQELNRIIKLTELEEEDAELIIYYAGHGYPDELTKVPYLIPVDVSGSELSNGVNLQELYLRLGNLKAKKVTVFLDACFTGGGRESGLMASRGVKVKPKEGALKGNLVVFSASSGDQSSLPYVDENHGIFTYHLLKKLQDTKGKISYGDLYDGVKVEVQKIALRKQGMDQEPKVNTSQKVAENWRNWKF